MQLLTALCSLQQAVSRGPRCAQQRRCGAAMVKRLTSPVSSSEPIHTDTWIFHRRIFLCHFSMELPFVTPNFRRFCEESGPEMKLACTAVFQTPVWLPGLKCTLLIPEALDKVDIVGSCRLGRNGKGCWKGRARFERSAIGVIGSESITRLEVGDSHRVLSKSSRTGAAFT